MRLANWLQQTPQQGDATTIQIDTNRSSFWESRALFIGEKFGLADEAAYAGKST
ncbi:MAG: hypothetical protein QNK31_11300 [Porticoccus sp.]|nr:hypothetical protein [Porticoccus sp.]